jgi:hypothetical protein
MAGTQALLVSNIQLSDVAADVYTTPSGRVTTITAFTLNNTSGRAANVTAHVLPAGATAAAANQVLTRLSVPAGIGPLQVPALVGQALPAGAKLRMAADVAEAITPLISGNVAETP